MASSLAVQLSQIAAKSTHQYDLKAQKASHAESLIFEKKIARTQDFETIFQLCYEGFQELCTLDERFQPFRRNLFSEQSKVEDRGQMTAGQNKELDNKIEDFLALVGSRLLLNPAVKAVDWLIRRFRIHEHNTAFLLFTFLPYHTTPLFLNLLSILPDDLTPTFKVLYPYKRSLSLPPRHPIVHSAATNVQFFSRLNNYVLYTGKAQAHYPGLISFWSGIMAEALASMLDSAKSGRIEVEKKNKEDALLRILPILNTGFTLKKAPQLVVACYILCVVLANKGSLSDKVINSLMEAVAGSWTQATVVSGITCLSVLAQQKDDVELPKSVVKSILRVEGLVDVIADSGRGCSITSLLVGLMKICSHKNKESLASSCILLISQLLQRDVMNEIEKTHVISGLLKTVDESHKSGHLADEVRHQISDVLAQIVDSESLSPLLQKALIESGVDVGSLEMTVQLAIDNSIVTSNTVNDDDVEMEDATDDLPQDDKFSKSVESLSQRPGQKSENFLVETPSPLFNELAHIFVQAAPAKNKLTLVTALPVLRKEASLEDPTFFSFLVRFFSGPYPNVARAKAIGIAATCILESGNKAADMQALLPYIISALSDPSELVRREAARLLSAVDGQLSKIKKTEQLSPWGQGFIYGSNKRSNSVQWLSTKEMQKIIHRSLMRDLEEYVLDVAQIGNSLVNIFRGSTSQKQDDSEESELKKSVRRDFFSFLCAHIVNTPLYTVKMRLLRIVNRIGKIGSAPRTQFLLPLLDKCRSLESEQINRIEVHEHIPIRELEEQVLSIIYPKDKDAIDILLPLVTDEGQSDRPSFLEAAFTRLKEIWPSLNEEHELLAADKLLDVCLTTNPQIEELKRSSRNLLQSVDLSGPVIVKFLSTITSTASDISSHSPAPKRRRTGQNNMVSMDSAKLEETNRFLQKISFILELINVSQPEEHPELLGGLFQTLAIIHRLKLQAQTEMSYLLSLNLGILLSIINKSKGSPKKLDIAQIRADLLIDCVRTSESPQVQNTALLLVAGLAAVAPEIILHSVMPIFTFMGSSVLRKDDEYSALVIDQTIDQVIPPLVHSLRAQKRDVVTGTSELLLSFATAYEHIPSYRRIRLFESLVNKLGQEDFLFAVLAMLATRYGMDRDVLATMTALASNAEAKLQLITYTRYMSLIQDALQPKPTLSRTLLGIGSEDGREPQKVAVDLLQALSHLLKYTSLGSQMVKYFEDDETDDAKKIHTLFSNILERLLSLAVTMSSVKPVSDACGDALATLLGTLSLVDFIDTIEVLLKRQDDDLRRRVLRLLESRLEHNNDRDKSSQSRALSFLSVLMNTIEESPDILLKHAAVTCSEKISEKYGKKDPEKVVAAAMVISGEKCMGLDDSRIRVIGVLCLASMTEVITEGIIPILPVALPRSLDLLQGSISTGAKNPQLHDGVYSFISALLVHIPYMLSSENLDRILQLSWASASAGLSEECINSRKKTLKLFAKRVEAKQMYNAVERNWSSATSQGPKAADEALQIAKLAIDKRPKSDTVKNISVLLKLLWKVFDFRRTQSSSHHVDYIEQCANDMVINMIYKLNDTMFRPIFVQLTEWAFEDLAKSDVPGRLARLTTFYNFLQTFFDRLKSIVTGYSNYIVENVVEVLKDMPSNMKAKQPLWLAVMRTLRNSFEHDQDEFWQAPSHFSPISGQLLNQLSISRDQSTLETVMAEAIPTIVELAGVADSPDNHKELNAHIMKYMRAGGSNADSKGNAFTRLAAVKCEQSLTERLGEEWLALLPEMLPYISELMEDDDENVEREVRKWILMIEEVLGEKLDDMLA